MLIITKRFNSIKLDSNWSGNKRKAFDLFFLVGCKKFVRSIVSLVCFLALFSCQKNDNKSFDQGQSLKDTANVSIPKITYLDSLSDTLQPKKIWIKDNSPPKTLPIPRTQAEAYTIRDGQNESRTILPPQIIQRSHLKNKKGEAILDEEGNHYYLGDGGISHFVTFTTDDGLSLDNITSSLLDQSGNLWLGTWGGGISKFDGTSFTNFTTAHGLSNNLIHCLAEDQEGNIWIGTEGGGISIYDGYTFTIKNTSDGLANDVIYGITPVGNGNIWIAAGEGGASKYDGENFTTYNQDNGLQGNSIIKIAEDNNGFVWFATGSHGISRFDGESFLDFSEKDGLAENAINCIKTDSSGNIWIGTKGGGISKYQESPDLKEKGTFTNFTTSKGLGHDDVWDIEEDLEGNLWFATGGGGVSKFDGEKFTNYTTAQGLPKNVVYSVSIDEKGNLWCGTAGGGISLYTGPAFNNFTSDLGLAKNSVYGILEDNSGNLWFGTDGGGLSKYNGKSFTNFTTDQGLPNPLVISALRDKNAQLWFGTGGGGIALFKKESIQSKKPSFTVFDTSNGLPNDIIYALKEDSQGNIWIGTGGAGLVKFDWNTEPSGQSGFITFNTDHGLGSNYIFSILEDRKGNLWVGTAGGGVSKFEGKSFTNFTTDQGLSNNIVWSILEDKVGNLWFATQGGGVSRFDGQSFSSFTIKEGLSDDTVYDLLEDKEGNIFIGTNQGFTVIPAQVATLPFSEIRGSLEYYNTANGYPVKDVNKGIYLDRGGNIWAGNGSDKTGLVKFNYQALRKNQKRPSIKIKKIGINEEPISWISLQRSNHVNKVSDSSKSLAYITDEVRVFGRQLSYEERKAQQEEFSKVQFSEIRRFENFPENLTLPYSQNQITIDFGTDELVRPNLIEYQYILKGYSKSWSPVIKNSRATFGNIGEGDYVFKVKARFKGPAEAEGKEWSEEVFYRFSVLPPWYRTWWAYLIYLILFVVVIRRIHVFQKNRTIRKERDRMQQRELEYAKEIEKAYLDLKATQSQLIQSEKMASLGELTAGIAHEIQNPLNFVNNFSEVSNELVDEMKEEFKKGDKKEGFAIADDIKQNLEKITRHGKRADAIVKGMLAHSCSSSGEKVPTDINALADEYLRLSYHGLKAREKSFNADFKTDFDPNLPKVNVVPQDIGRVLLNLINNAFQASVSEKNLSGLSPAVIVSTKNLGDKIEITVTDNGPGIPDDIKDKIFQPFFTTKPTGQGTGLGLSLSYDIVKAHRGKISFESRKGKGSTFLVQLAKQL